MAALNTGWLDLDASSALARTAWLDQAASSGLATLAGSIWAPRTPWLTLVGFIWLPRAASPPCLARSGRLERPDSHWLASSGRHQSPGSSGWLDLTALGEPGCQGRTNSIWQARFGWLSSKASTLSFSPLLASFMLHCSASI